MNRVAPVDASFSLEQSQNDALDADPSKLDQQEQISFKFPKEKAKQRRQRLAEALQLQQEEDAPPAIKRGTTNEEENELPSSSYLTMSVSN